MSISHETQLIEAAAKLLYEQFDRDITWNALTPRARELWIRAMTVATEPLRSELEHGEIAIISNGTLLAKNTSLRKKLKQVRQKLKDLEDNVATIIDINRAHL